MKDLLTSKLSVASVIGVMHFLVLKYNFYYFCGAENNNLYLLCCLMTKPGCQTLSVCTVVADGEIGQSFH